MPKVVKKKGVANVVGMFELFFKELRIKVDAKAEDSKVDNIS